MEQYSRRDLFQLALESGFFSLGQSICRATPSEPSPIVRINVVEEEVYATKDGSWVATNYDPKEGAGKLGQLPYPDVAEIESPFWKHFQTLLQDQTKDLEHGPVVVLVHGFYADPRDEINPKQPQGGDNPHAFSFHFSKEEQTYWRHTASWPIGLGLTKNEHPTPGLPIAFAWNSMPDLFTQGMDKTLQTMGKVLVTKPSDFTKEDLEKVLTVGPSFAKAISRFDQPMEWTTYQKLLREMDQILTNLEEPLGKITDYLPEIYRQPYRRATQAAWVLVNLLRVIAQTLPNQPIDFFCHSLGSRVVLQAIQQLAKQCQKPQAQEWQQLLQRLGKILIVGGSEYSVRAQAVLKELRKLNQPVGPQFYNFMARRDRVLGLIAQRFHLIKPEKDEAKLDRTIGLCGLDTETQEPNWMDLQLDQELDGQHPLNDWLQKKNRSVQGAHPWGLIHHWHYFTDPKNMEVYRTILQQRHDWDIKALRKAKIPERSNREPSK